MEEQADQSILRSVSCQPVQKKICLSVKKTPCLTDKSVTSSHVRFILTNLVLSNCKFITVIMPPKQVIIGH